MYDEFQRQARELLERFLKAKDVEMDELIFESPPHEYGDLGSPLCFDLAPKLRKPPISIAKELVEELDLSKSTLITSVKAVNGYVNFFLDYKRFSKELLTDVLSKGDEFGRGDNKGEIILEHTSANPDGPLHIGHGRNSIIGDCLARILRFSGYKVETQFYVNDMGKQLAHVVLGLRKLKLDESIKRDHAIATVYGKIHEMLEENPELEEEVSDLMQAYEAGDDQVVSEFTSTAELCLEGIRQSLDRMAVKHDDYVWESRFVRDLSVQKIVEKLEKTRYAKKEEVLFLDLQEFGIEKELVLKRKDGTYLYTTRDLAYHKWKSEKGQVIDVWGADHKLVAQQMRAVLKILGEEEPEFVIYEFITLPEGSMSTRRGVYISVDDLLDESVKRAFTEVEKRRPDATQDEKNRIAELVGVGAIRFNIARVSAEKGMVFRWEEALDFERQGAPFLQYAHARACRILEKAGDRSDFEVHELSDNEKKLVLTIAKFPSVVKIASDARKPSIIAGYALALADAFNRFYKFEPVLKSKEVNFRLGLVDSTRIILRNSLALLGIEAPNKM